MMLMSLNMIAQIELNDRNWDRVLHDNFNTSGRTWNSYTFNSSDGLWRAYPGSGVTHGTEKQVYQFRQCRFNDIDGTMELVAEYDVDRRIPCQSDLDNFNYAVKKTVSVTSMVDEPIVSSGENVTFRVTDSFEITGAFEVQQGGKFTVIQQDCSNDNQE